MTSQQDTASAVLRSAPGRPRARGADAGHLRRVAARREEAQDHREPRRRCAQPVGQRVRLPPPGREPRERATGGCSNATPSCTPSAYAVDHLGDIYLSGRLPLHAVTPDEVDRLLGSVLDASDSSFNVILEMGFAVGDPQGVGLAHLARRADLEPRGVPRPRARRRATAAGPRAASASRPCASTSVARSSAPAARGPGRPRGARRRRRTTAPAAHPEGRAAAGAGRSSRRPAARPGTPIANENPNTPW